MKTSNLTESDKRFIGICAFIIILCIETLAMHNGFGIEIIGW